MRTTPRCRSPSDRPEDALAKEGAGRVHHPPPVRHQSLAAALLVSVTLGAGSGSGAAPADREPLAFEVTYPPDLHRGPIAARVYVMLGPIASGGEPRKGPNWFRPQPFFAAAARDCEPG